MGQRIGKRAVMLQLHEVVTGYRRPVSAPVSFSLARGEVIGLVGPNGIGKSTLLKSLLGQAKIFSGTVHLAPKTRTSYLPQQAPRMTQVPISGFELLAAVGAHEARAPERLAEKLDARIDQLSGGEYQLLMLWATLVRPADLVLLDEPTNNLDAHHIQTAIDAIAKQRSDRGSLVISHDLDFLQSVCTHIITLEAADSNG